MADDIMPAGRLQLQMTTLLKEPQVGCWEAAQFALTGSEYDKYPGRTEPHREKDTTSLRCWPMVGRGGGNIALYDERRWNKVGSAMIRRFKISGLSDDIEVAEAGFYVDVLPDVSHFVTEKHEGSLSKNYKAEYRYALEVIAPYENPSSYPSAKALVDHQGTAHGGYLFEQDVWHGSLIRQVPLKPLGIDNCSKRLRHIAIKTPKARRLRRPSNERHDRGTVYQSERNLFASISLSSASLKMRMREMTETCPRFRSLRPSESAQEIQFDIIACRV